jgi:small multidrug resistance family-3 protein
MDDAIAIAFSSRRRVLNVAIFGTKMIDLIKISALFALTAVAEILGCYLPWLAIKEGKSLWLLLPGGLSLAAFSWLLTLHPTAAGRTYAAYGGVYIAVALLWLRVVEGIALTRWDLAGAALALGGMALIALQPAS